MFEKLIRFCHRAPMAGVAGRHWHGRRRRVQLPKFAHRRRAGHHQRPSADQYRSAGLFTVGDRATGDLPIETVMAGLPGLEQTRSHRYGLSQVTVIFKDGAGHLPRASWSMSASRKHRINCRSASHLRWGRSPPAWGEFVDGRGEGRTNKTRWLALYRDRPARDSGLDHQATAAMCRRDRDQFDWRFCQRNTDHPAQSRTCWLLSGRSPCEHRDGTGSQQQQRRRGSIKRGGQYHHSRLGGSRPLEDIGNVILSGAGGVPIRRA